MEFSSMKKSLSALALAAACAGAAHADNVTIYGVVDAGLSYYSNAANSTGGKATLSKIETGVAQANRLGYKGSEDLGQGQQAFFVLESGFNLDDGTLGQGGVFFGRQSFVGWSDKALGSVSIGRQYDFMSQLGALYAMGSQSAAGSMAWGVHADAAGATVLNDHIYNGDRSNNSIKYNSSSVNGLSVGLMYALGEVAGNARANRTVSARASYDDGPLSLGAAYTDVNNATGLASTRIYGLGGRYQLGRWKPFALLTHVKAGATGTAATTYDLGVTYGLSEKVDLSGGYLRQTRNNNVANVQQLTGALDYKFSKRTDVYLAWAYNRDQGRKSYAVFGGGSQSSDGQQNVLRAGIRHLF
jgi:predicted porin